MKHILINGERGVGKSTIAARLLSTIALPVYGFITKSLPANDNGFHPIYIHPAGSSARAYTAVNRIGLCNQKIREVNPAAFDTFGVQYIRSAKPGGVILMDELGFMETGSPEFLSAVSEALNGEIPVLATVKARYDIPFLNEVRSHPNALVFTLTPENRDDLYEEILSAMKAW